MMVGEIIIAQGRDDFPSLADIPVVLSEDIDAVLPVGSTELVVHQIVMEIVGTESEVAHPEGMGIE